MIKARVLAGCNILFTHVIPIRERKETSEVWKRATEFGAQCSKDWNNQVTHLVVGDKGTEKVRQARTRNGVYVVWKEWFFDSVSKWQRQLEDRYLVDGIDSSPPSSSDASHGRQVTDTGVEIVTATEQTDEDDTNTEDIPHVSEDLVSEHLWETNWEAVLQEVDEFMAESEDTSAIESEGESSSESRTLVAHVRRSQQTWSKKV
jgi:RNA polymerase II subunit A-like phosphatase